MKILPCIYEKHEEIYYSNSNAVIFKIVLGA